MLSTTSLKLIAPVLELLGLEDLTLEHDYWILGPMGLGLKYVNPPGHQVELHFIVTSPRAHIKESLARFQIKTHPVYSAGQERRGIEFSFKDFNIRVFEDERELHDIPELRLLKAMQTLLEVHGPELKQVLERYLSYGLNLERGLTEYFGWGSEWRERLMALPDPGSREAIVRFSC